MKKVLSKRKDERSGIATILTVGVLAMLVLTAITFAISTRLELFRAKNYLNSVRARYLADAGLARAIAELKNDTRTNFAYNDNVSISGERS